MPLDKVTKCKETNLWWKMYWTKCVKPEKKWKIEKIVKTRGKGRNKQYFVKWLHWPKKFNSWISARDVNNL